MPDRIRAWDVRAACTGLHRVPTEGHGLTVVWLTATPSGYRTFAVVRAFVTGTAADPSAAFARLLSEAGAGDVRVHRVHEACDVEVRADAVTRTMLEAMHG